MEFLKKFKKELILTLKNKDIITSLLIGPIALTILFGCVYMKGYVENIPLAVIDEDNSTISRTIVQQFKEKSTFDLKYYANSKEELKELMDSRKVAVAVYIPSNFSKDLSGVAGSAITVLIDESNVVTGNTAYSSAVSIIQTVSTGINIKVLQAKGSLPPVAMNMATSFNFNDRTLYDSRLLYLNYLILGFIAVFFQQVMMSGVGIVLIKDGYSITHKFNLRNLVIKILACSFYAVFSVLLSICFVSMFLHVPIRGSIALALMFCVIFAFAISCPSIIFASLLKDKIKYAQLIYMLSLPTFVTSGYIWPLDETPKVLVILLKLFWPLINFAKPFNDLLFKGLFPWRAILGLLLYIVFWMPLAIFIMKSRFNDIYLY